MGACALNNFVSVTRNLFIKHGILEPRTGVAREVRNEGITYTPYQTMIYETIPSNLEAINAMDEQTQTEVFCSLYHHFEESLELLNETSAKKQITSVLNAVTDGMDGMIKDKMDDLIYDVKEFTGLFVLGHRLYKEKSVSHSNTAKEIYDYASIYFREANDYLDKGKVFRAYSSYKAAKLYGQEAALKASEPGHDSIRVSLMIDINDMIATIDRRLKELFRLSEEYEPELNNLIDKEPTSYLTKYMNDENTPSHFTTAQKRLLVAQDFYLESFNELTAKDITQRLEVSLSIAMNALTKALEPGHDSIPVRFVIDAKLLIYMIRTQLEKTISPMEVARILFEKARDLKTDDLMAPFEVKRTVFLFAKDILEAMKDPEAKMLLDKVLKELNKIN